MGILKQCSPVKASKFNYLVSLKGTVTTKNDYLYVFNSTRDSLSSDPITVNIYIISFKQLTYRDTLFRFLGFQNSRRTAAAWIIKIKKAYK